MQEECAGWKRMLELLMHENVGLKTRLAEIVKESKEGHDFVALAEHYHNTLMREDEIIYLARRDVADLDKLLLREVFEDGILYGEVNRKHKRLRKELLKIEKDFNKLKQGFDVFFNKKIQK